MENIINISIDLERDNVVRFTKPKSFDIPETHDEAKEMIIKDISHMCLALVDLISLADHNGYSDRVTLINTSVRFLIESLVVDNDHDHD